MRLPKLDTLIQVTWWDIVGAINERSRRIEPQRCVTIGRLLRVEKDYILVASSIYEGEGEDPTVDGTAIPLGVCESIKRV